MSLYRSLTSLLNIHQRKRQTRQETIYPQSKLHNAPHAPTKNAHHTAQSLQAKVQKKPVTTFLGYMEFLAAQGISIGAEGSCFAKTHFYTALEAECLYYRFLYLPV